MDQGIISEFPEFFMNAQYAHCSDWSAEMMQKDKMNHYYYKYNMLYRYTALLKLINSVPSGMRVTQFLFH